MIKYLNLKELNSKFDLSDAINEILNSGCYLLGKKTEEFEKVCPNFFLKRNTFLKFCKYLQRNEMFNLEDLFFGTNTADVTLMVKNDYGSVIIEKNNFSNDAMGREKRFRLYRFR